MKPLPVAPLTDVDFAIWDRLCQPYRLAPGNPEWQTIESDRRDAAMMLRLAYMRSLLVAEARYPRGYRRVIAHTVLSGHCTLGKDPGTAFNIPTP